MRFTPYLLLYVGMAHVFCANNMENVEHVERELWNVDMEAMMKEYTQYFPLSQTHNARHHSMSLRCTVISYCVCVCVLCDGTIYDKYGAFRVAREPPLTEPLLE